MTGSYCFLTAGESDATQEMIAMQEFKGRDRTYYEEAFRTGRLRVDAPNVTSTTPLRNSQRILHALHRHEPPVLALPLQVCYRVWPPGCREIADCLLKMTPMHAHDFANVP